MAERSGWASGKLRRCASLVAKRAAPPVAVALLRGRTRRPDVLLPLAALTGWLVAEVLAEDDAANARAAQARTQDAGTRYAMVGTHLLSWWLPILAASRSHGSRRSVAAGLALVLGGGALRVLSIRTLGRRFTGHVQVLPEQEICDRGPYALVRHPSYVGLLGINVGPAVCCGATTVALGMALATAAATRHRVLIEERALAELGAAYHAYAARTPRFVPIGRLVGRWLVVLR